jgi:hypothetical protein
MTMSRGARRVIDSARDAYSAAPSDRARIRKALSLKLAVGATAATGIAAGAAPAALGSKAILGLVASVAVGGTLTIGVVGRMNADHGVPAEVPQHPASARVAPSAKSLPQREGAPQVAPSLAAPATTALDGPPRGTTREPASARLPKVELELSLLGDAQRALSSGDARRALRLLDTHAERFPRAALSEERDAARVSALCALGRRTEARALADDFLARSPASPLARRVRSACPDE